MDVFKIQGGKKLEGEVKVQGSKNAVLPILVATILHRGKSIIHNCPRIKDVFTMIDILKYLGCQVEFIQDTVIVDASGELKTEVPTQFVSQMRSSIFLMGAIIGRERKLKISYPGGCDIGHRPIDLHIKGLRKLGVEIVDDESGLMECLARDLKGCEIHLDFPSVGATENIMLAASVANGHTIIRNAAKEPEIVDLQNFLNSMGAQIYGAGSNTIFIEGVKKFRDVEYKIIPDRIVAGTFMVASAITSGDILIRDVILEHNIPVITKLEECGCTLYYKDNELRVIGPKRPKAIEVIKTLPYPGFPTDMQPQMMALLSIASGTSVIYESIYDSRYKHADELNKMRADIRIDSRIAVIRGVDKLIGTQVTAKDLRGGAALTLAGIAAKGTTVIEGIHHIDRGYQTLENYLQELGADIERVSL